MMKSTMGVYIDPAQQAEQVAQDNEQIFGAQDAKTAAMNAKAQAALMTPYYRALMKQNVKTPQFDLSPVADWSGALAHSAGNLLNLMMYRQQQKQDQDALNQWQGAIQEQQNQADLATRRQAKQVEENADYIRQTYGDQAAHAYMLSPQKYSDSLGTHFGEVNTLPQKAVAEQQGKGAAYDVGQQQVKDHGLDLSVANTQQLSPIARNLVQGLTGQTPEDVLDFNKRYNDNILSDTQARYAQPNASNKVVSDTLANQNAAIQNRLSQIRLELEPKLKELEVQGKSLEVQGKAQDFYNKKAAYDSLTKVLEQMGNGQQLTPQDASRLDQMLGAAGIKTDFLGDIKTITNPKAGSALSAEKVKNATGANGWVHLGSGYYQNPQTGEVSKGPAGAPAGGAAPATGKPAKNAKRAPVMGAAAGGKPVPAAQAPQVTIGAGVPNGYQAIHAPEPLHMPDLSRFLYGAPPVDLRPWWAQ